MPVVTDGGRGTGVEAEGLNYPFVSPSDDIKGLLADLHLSHTSLTAALPLRVTWLYGFCRAQQACGSDSVGSSAGPDPAHEADLVVRDADGTVVFDSTTAATFRSRAWGTRFWLYEWVGTAGVCRALVHTGADDPALARVFPIEIVPEDGTLDERAHEPVPPRVTSVTVNGVVFGPGVEIVLGHNVTATPTPVARGRRAGRRVVLAAAAGTGEGRYQSCVEPEVVVRRVNGVTPDEFGNLTLAVGGRGANPPCYWLERPVTGMGAEATVTPAAVRLNDDCGPCCACEDYVNTYRGVRRLYARYQAVGEKAAATRDAYREARTTWLDEVQCRRDNPVTVDMTPHGDGYVDVTAGYRNVTDNCKFRVRMVLVFTRALGGVGRVSPNSTRVSLFGGGSEVQELAGEWPEYSHTWDAVPAGGAVRLLTRVLVEDLPTDDSITATVTVYVSNTTPVGVAAVTRALVAGADGDLILDGGDL